MARDKNLALVDNLTPATITADGNSTAINVEGGLLAWVVLQLGACATGTLDIRVQTSQDGGSNYYMVGKFQQVQATSAGLLLRIPVYIPRPAASQTVTKVRLNYDNTGGGSHVITYCYIEPMVGISVPANDEANANGAALKLFAS